MFVWKNRLCWYLNLRSEEVLSGFLCNSIYLQTAFAFPAAASSVAVLGTQRVRDLREVSILDFIRRSAEGT
jgi:hypothetical protein